MFDRLYVKLVDYLPWYNNPWYNYYIVLKGI